MSVAMRTVLLLVAVLSAFATVGAGTATAEDQYVGKTYASASGDIAKKGLTPVISTVVGDQLATADCIVTSSRKVTYAANDNFDHGKEYLLSLNCSAKLAHGGPGNSLASPQGRAEKKKETRAAQYNAKPEKCEKDLDTCKQFCDKNVGLCSNEVMALF